MLYILVFATHPSSPYTFTRLLHTLIFAIRSSSPYTCLCDTHLPLHQLRRPPTVISLLDISSLAKTIAATYYHSAHNFISEHSLPLFVCSLLPFTRICIFPVMGLEVYLELCLDFCLRLYLEVVLGCRWYWSCLCVGVDFDLAWEVGLGCG